MWCLAKMTSHIQSVSSALRQRVEENLERIGDSTNPVAVTSNRVSLLHKKRRRCVVNGLRGDKPRELRKPMIVYCLEGNWPTNSTAGREIGLKESTDRSQTTGTDRMQLQLERRCWIERVAVPSIGNYRRIVLD